MLNPPDASLPGIERLRQIVGMLRSPEGCPWDREQSHQTLRGGLLEEAYEVVEAIDRADHANLKEELGDLLLQVVFHAQLGQEDGRFDFNDVAHGIVDKLVRRHPHVFGDTSCADSAEVLARWDELKKAEKAPNGAAAPESALDGVPNSLPALMKAQAVQKKAGKVGFDWSEPAPILDKIREELAEVEQQMAQDPRDPRKLEEEIGDLLFAVVNLARKLKLEAEVALCGATQKFTRRFHQVEALARERGLAMKEMTLEELDRLWDEVKASSPVGG